MPSQAIHRFGIARFLRRRPFWAVLALASATAWARPPDEPDAPKATGVPYEGLSAKDLKALAGTKFDVVPRTGKTLKYAELIQATPGKQPGTLRSIDFKPVDGGAKRNMQAKSVARLVAGSRVYEVMPDHRQKSAFLLVDLQSRDVLVNAKLKLIDERRYALWPKLTAEEQAKALEENKTFLNKVDDTITTRKFQLHETDYFLFYTDIPQASLTPIVANLDRMYATLGKQFGIPAGTNIWHGKAMIVIFSTWDFFARFGKVVMENPVAGDFQSIHHAMNNGDVLVASTIGDDADADESARQFVRNAVRCYLYRYRSNVYLPEWIGEGIVSLVAAGVIDDKALRGHQQRDAETVRGMGRLNGYLNQERINVGWQWGVASSLAELLIKTDAQAHRQFVLGIKEGQTWQESLQDAYGLSPAELVGLYGQQIGLPNLRP